MAKQNYSKNSGATPRSMRNGLICDQTIMNLTRKSSIYGL